MAPISRSSSIIPTITTPSSTIRPRTTPTAHQIQLYRQTIARATAATRATRCIKARASATTKSTARSARHAAKTKAIAARWAMAGTRIRILESANAVLARLLSVENDLWLARHRPREFDLGREGVGALFSRGVVLRSELFWLWERLERECRVGMGELARENEGFIDVYFDVDADAEWKGEGEEKERRYGYEFGRLMGDLWPRGVVKGLEEVEWARRSKRRDGVAVTMLDLGVEFD